MTLKTIWDILKATVSKWVDDNVPRLSAALAFYSLFSVAPILIIAVSFAGLIYGERAARGELVLQIRQITGEHGAFIIQTLVASAYDFRSGIFATLAAVVTLVFGASAVFVELQGAMDTIWRTETKSGGALKLLIKQRLLAFLMLPGIGLLLLLSLFTGTLVSFFSNYLPAAAGRLFQAGEFAASFVVITILFAMIYKVLPSQKIPWTNVWAGAVLTSLLFTIGKFLIGLYLSHSSASSTFGAAGSLVVLLFWIYYSAQVFFFGAELTQVYTSRLATSDTKGDDG